MEQENVQVKSGKVEVRRVSSIPKHSQTTWDRAQLEYESGSWTSLVALSKKYGINYKTFYAHLKAAKWQIKRAEILREAELQVKKAAVKELSKVDLYRQRLAVRALKYEQILDKSIEQTGELVEPSDLDSYTRSEMRVVEMNKVALNMAPPSLDITTGGKGLGESFISAIAKLRASPDSPRLNDSDLKSALEAEIE